MSGHVVPVKTYLGIFVALLALTALTTGAAFVDFEKLDTGIRLVDAIPLNTVVALAIAVAKMLLVILFFMHVKYEANWKYVLTIPAGFMSIFLLLALVPDIGMRGRWLSEERQNYMAVPRSVEEERVIRHSEDEPAGAAHEAAGEKH